MGAIWNGREVTNEEYWRLRLEEVISKGCTREDLEDLCTDLDMELFQED